MVQTSCSDKSQQASSAEQQSKPKPTTNDLFKQVLLLDEFKAEEKRVDSVSRISGIPIKVSVDIVGDSFLEEDKGKNISLAFINEQYPYDRLIMYTIKFDKNRKKIVSVSKDSKSFERALSLGTPQDTLIPLK